MGFTYTAVRFLGGSLTDRYQHCTRQLRRPLSFDPAWGILPPLENLLGGVETCGNMLDLVHCGTVSTPVATTRIVEELASSCLSLRLEIVVPKVSCEVLSLIPVPSEHLGWHSFIDPLL